MKNIVYVTELTIGKQVVYKRELTHSTEEPVTFRQYKADAVTGEEIK